MTPPLDLNIFGYRFYKYDGYGRFSLAVIKALLATGRVNVYPEQVEATEMPGWFIRAKGLDLTRPSLAILPPHEMRGIPKVNYLYTMYEATRIPDAWAGLINQRVEHLLVPCDWMAEVFAQNGVEVPISVVYGGTDPAENPILQRPADPNRPYTFIALGDRGARKGYNQAWAAFCQAFTPEDNVRLIIKCRPTSDPAQLDNRHSPDPMTRKIVIWAQDVEDVSDVFAHADCCVYPATADGWGMFPREAACSGLPVIATNYSGTAVGCEHWAYPLNDFKIGKAELPSPRNAGEWAYPSVDEIAHYMRFCYDHPAEARAKGAAAAQWIRANQTWEHTAARLLDILEYEHLDRLIENQQRERRDAETIQFGGNLLAQLAQRQG